MAIETQWVRYDGAAPYLGYLAYPERATEPLPAVLVLQEAWGLDAHIEEVTRRFAAAGYAAFAPDLYAEQGERPRPLTRERLLELQAFINGKPMAVWADPEARAAELAKLAGDQRQRIGESFEAMRSRLVASERFVPQLLASTDHLRRTCRVTAGEKIASVGFCLGGGLSALLATHDPELAAAVIFYGSAPPAERVPEIGCPVLGLYGSLDERINGGIPGFADAMKQHGKSFEHHIYEGAQHAFFNDGRPSYHAGAARDAFVRTLELFRDTLS